VTPRPARRITVSDNPHRMTRDSGRRVHSISNFLSLLAVRVARDERQEIVQRQGEITPGTALCIAVECAAVISEPGLFDR
jgi:hypothetical protein